MIINGRKKCLGFLYLVYMHKHMYQLFCIVDQCLKNAFLCTSKGLKDENTFMSRQRLMLSPLVSPSSGQSQVLHFIYAHIGGHVSYMY